MSVAQTPLVAQAGRQAHTAFAGFIYQIQQTILRWLDLKDDEALFLEGVEDCDIVSSQDQQAQLFQFKARTDTVSLGRAEIIETLNNFWTSVTDNPDFRCELRYVTTSPVVAEQRAPFGSGISGIERWPQAQTDRETATKIRDYLLTRTGLDAKLARFLRGTDLPALQEQFFGRVTWVTSAPTLPALEPEIKCRLVLHGDRHSFTVEASEAAYPEVFQTACMACTRAGARRLTREDFLRVFEKGATVYRENALLKRSLLISPAGLASDAFPAAGAKANLLSVIDGEDFVSRLAASSRPLAEWPSTLPDGRELRRPEYDTLLETLSSRDCSTTLLLGEPGSGKSALLSRLMQAGASRPDTVVLGIKADMLPSTVATPDDLLPGWEGRDLARWLRILARRKRVWILVDQLDAVAEIMDRRTERLNVLLSLIGSVANHPGVHVVASCRPFEFHHDARLRAIKAGQPTQLQPVGVEQVDEALSSAGHDPGGLSAACRQMLRSPWHLNAYLQHAHPGDEAVSLHVLLARIWANRIASSAAPHGTRVFFSELAAWVREEEQLWIPIGRSDRNPEAYDYLCAEGLLIEAGNGLHFGFRHQTLFDYALLREFEAERVDLSAYVWRKQDGLFVRPTMLAGLRHLRSTARAAYHRELGLLLRLPSGRASRFHIRDLLLEFVGSQQEPTAGEAELLLPLLSSPDEGPRVLHACASSRGWFARLAVDPGFHRWLKASPDKASLALNSLHAAFGFSDALAAGLVTRYWLPKPGYHSLILRALGFQPALGPGALRILKSLAGKVPPADLGLVLNEVLKTDPAACADLIRLSLEKCVRAALAEQRRNAKSGRTALENVLGEEIWGYWPATEFVAAAPRPFLAGCWPLVEKVLLPLIKTESRTRDGSYPDAEPTLDYPSRQRHRAGLLLPLMDAARELAAKDPVYFRQFVRRASRCTHLFAQRLVAWGFLNNIPALGQDAQDWLLADPRRLNLGNYWDVDETVLLFQALGADPAADPARIALLEAAALRYRAKPDMIVADTEEQRRELAAWKTRRRQGRLLQALPRERLSPTAAERLTGIEKDLGDSALNPKRLEGGFVGPPVTKEELAGMSDDAIIALIGRLPDTTQAKDPDGKWENGVDRAGGAIQQSRALGAFIALEPARGLRLASRLQPGINELYAGKLLVALAGSNLPRDQVLEVFRNFLRRGFTGPDFRVEAAEALETLAKRGAGLPDDAVELLLLRLDEWPRVLDKPESGADDDESTRSVLFTEGSWSVTDSSSQLMSAIIRGVLERRDPDRHDRMLAVLRRVDRKPRSDFFWAQALLECLPVFAARPKQATAFLRRVIRRQPAILRHTPGRDAAGHALRYLEPAGTAATLVRTALGNRGKGNRQFAGELAFLAYAFHPTPAHRRMLRSTSGPDGLDYLRGLAFAAVHCFRYPGTHKESRAIVAQALAARRDSVVRAGMGFIRKLDFAVLDPEERELVRKFLGLGIKRSQFHLPDLVKGLAAGCAHEPGLADLLCTRLLETAERDPQDFRRSLSRCQQDLVNIALTLHRLPAFRDRGLVLFEWMLRLNLRELQDALKRLDQRETPAGTG